MCPDARDDFDNGPKVSAWNVQMCDYGTYCCRAVNDHKNCCANATAPKVNTKFLGAFQFETSTAGASSTRKPTMTSSASTSSSPSRSSTALLTEVLTSATSSVTPISAPSSCEIEKRHTAVVGGALGGVFGAAIFGLLGVILYLAQKEKKQRKLKEHYEAQFATTAWGTYGTGMSSRSTVVEADGGRDPVEKEAEVRYIGK
ncbi:hypothetical protein N0V90_003708 [Kalmusia sp. IMI 367209]|nr:hypothetical protein N0V90_003708 [Kalmusia sp. IMI 367209]